MPPPATEGEKVQVSHKDAWNTPTTTSSDESPSKRASRHNKISNEVEHSSFTRTTTTTRTKPNNPPSSSTTSTEYRIGDCIILQSKISENHKFLRPPIYQLPPKPIRSSKKGKEKKEVFEEEYQGWKHEDGLQGSDKVGVITRLFEDVGNEKKALVRWFARPGAVWGEDGPDEEALGGQTLPYELYYTADSSHLIESRQLRERALLTSPQKKKSSSKSPLKPAYLSSAASLKTPLHSDSLLLSSITSLCEVLSYDPSSPPLDQSSQRLHPTFIVRKVYDVKPISGAGFWADLVDDEEQGVGGWERLRLRGVEGWEEKQVEKKTEGWQVEPVLEDEEEEERERERRIRERKKSIKGKGKEVVKVRARDREDEESESDSGEEEGEAFAPNRHSDASSSSEGGDSSSEGEEEEASEEEASSDEEETYSRTPTKRKRRNSQLPTPSSSLRRSTSASPKKRTRPPRTTTTTSRTTKRRRLATKDASSTTHNSLPPLLSSSFLASLPSPLERAKALLHVSATPENLPCRDEQRSRIRQFVGDAVLSRTGGCLYVHGVPGTGKTATVHSVVRELQNDPEMDSFTFVEINGMKISEANTAFCHLWNALNTTNDHKSKPSKISPKAALSALEGWFANPDPARKTTVVLVDELDQMLSKRQEVLYNFFNWPHSAHSRLVVIAVANTMDLPEREMSGKIRSRLGTNRIPFQPYNWNELKRILEARLSLVTSSDSSTPVRLFEDTALQKIAKSVAGISGDARKALDVARRTLDRVALRQQEEGEEGGEVKCTIKDATAAYNEMTKNGMTGWIKNSSFHQKVLMLGLAQCIRRSGVLEVELDSVISWHDTFLRQTHLIPSNSCPSKSDLLSCISDLHAQRLLATESARLDVFQKVRAMVEEGDVFAALREDELLKNHVPNA